RPDLPAAAACAAFATARGRLDRPGDQAQAAAARGRRADVVLRTLQPQALRGILPPARHRAGFLQRVRELLPLRRPAHLQVLRPPQSASDGARNERRLAGGYHLTGALPATGRSWAATRRRGQPGRRAGTNAAPAWNTRETARRRRCPVRRPARRRSRMPIAAEAAPTMAGWMTCSQPATPG